MPDFVNRLREYLKIRGLSPTFESLTSDASTREYFRIRWQNGSAIACVYPEAFKAGEQSFLDVTGLFRSSGLPVAEIYDFDEPLGIIVQEDLGNTILRDVLSEADEHTRDALFDQAITLIARIQKATAAAYAGDSIASRLKFDSEKLLWELDFFTEHYFRTFRKVDLPTARLIELRSEFIELSKDLESKARVLCHRDFHAANLMIDARGDLRIIDHQDARIGSTAYDLVSLLLDRVTSPPAAEWLAEKRRLFISERAEIGLGRLDDGEFADEFRLQTIQRCLKAVGTFSFQSVNRGKTYFIPFIEPMFQIVLRSTQNLDRFPVLHEMISEETNA